MTTSKSPTTLRLANQQNDGWRTGGGQAAPTLPSILGIGLKRSSTCSCSRRQVAEALRGAPRGFVPTVPRTFDDREGEHASTRAEAAALAAPARAPDALSGEGDRRAARLASSLSIQAAVPRSARLGAPRGHANRRFAPAGARLLRSCRRFAPVGDSPPFRSCSSLAPAAPPGLAPPRMPPAARPPRETSRQNLTQARL